MSPSVAGVDWAGDGWIAVYFRDGSYAGYSFSSRFDELWENRDPPNLVLVDVPIGLPEDPSSLQRREELDSLARSVTDRPSSIFPVPSREACSIAYREDGSYGEVVAQNEDDLDKGMNWQSYYIASGIGEIDAYLQQNEGAEQRIIESHPEVCFRALLGRSLEYKKDCAAGVGERLEALETLIENPGETLGEIFRVLQGESDVIDVDDVLDATVLGATGMNGKEELAYLPSDWGTDPFGIPIRMAYWTDGDLIT